MRFIDRSRRVKKLLFIRVKNRMGSRGYWTDHYIDRSEDGWEEGYSDHQWIDIFFVSKKYANVFYNCTLITGCMQYWDAFNDVVWNKVKVEVGEEIWKQAHEWTKERVKGGWKINYTYPDVRRVVMDRITEMEIEYGKGGEIEVSEEINYNYQYGVGLNATIACDNITGEVIEKWIKDFYARGEVVRDGEKFVVTPDMLSKWNYYRK